MDKHFLHSTSFDGSSTVYDGGTYAGDSLIAFFPKDENRIISFGEDMTVTCSFTCESGHEYCAVQITSGVMKIDTKRINTTKYTFRNASSETNETKKLTLEHPILPNAILTEPTEYFEKTHNLYRFEIMLSLGETTFAVIETEHLSHETNILKKSSIELERHISSTHLPKHVREKFKEAMILRQAIYNENEKVKKLKSHIDQLYKEQDRIRKNLEAAGSQTQQGQKYLSRLAQQDAEIDETQKAVILTEQATKEAEDKYQEYVYKMHYFS